MKEVAHGPALAEELGIGGNVGVEKLRGILA